MRRSAPPSRVRLGPLALLLLFVACMQMSAPCTAAEVTLLTAPYVRAGAYVPIRVTGAGSDVHELGGEGVMSVQWEGGSDVTLPVLLSGSPGGRLRIQVDGEAVSIPIVPLGRGERLVVDLAGIAGDSALTDIGSQLFPGETVHTLAAAPSGAPAAWGVANAVVFEAPPSEEDLQAWMSAGVAVVALAEPQGDAWRALAPAGPWVAQPVDIPAPGLIEPSIYSAVSSWQPGRTSAERRSIVVGCMLYGVMITVICWTVGDGARRAGLLIAVSLTAIGLTGAWAWLRADVAVRQADVLLTRAERQPISERWLFVRSSAAGEGAIARVGFVGETRPAGYDRRHWEDLDPLLLCDEAGQPRELRLRLPAGYTAAVVQRTAGAARGDARFEAWASPLIVQHYRRRLGAFDASESPEGATLSLRH